MSRLAKIGSEERRAGPGREQRDAIGLLTVYFTESFEAVDLVGTLTSCMYRASRCEAAAQVSDVFQERAFGELEP